MWIPVHAERVEKNRVYDKTKPPEQEVKGTLSPKILLH